jgi:hypothetical protein
VIFIDAVKVKIRDGQVAHRPIYVAPAVTCEGTRDILGLWAGEHGDAEGAKAPDHHPDVLCSPAELVPLWQRILHALKNLFADGGPLVPGWGLGRRNFELQDGRHGSESNLDLLPALLGWVTGSSSGTSGFR